MNIPSFKGVLPLMCAIALVSLPLAGCDDGSGTDDDPDTSIDTVTDADPDTSTDAPEDPVEDVVEDTTPDAPPLGCDSLISGLNSGFVVDGEPRTFYLDLPTGVDTGGPWPVIFNWHGMGDSAANMRNLFVGQVDNATMPFILVTPEDTDFALAGMMVIDWDVAAVTESNREARLFDEVLACIDTNWGLDTDHIHSAGFSMGGFVTDMLGTIRGDQMASVVTWSGAYGSNSANLSGMLASMVTWPEHTTTNAYAQMFLHGGDTDTYNMVVQQLYFATYAENDSSWLGGKGHDSVVCNHNSGHTVTTDMYGDKAVQFFADHPLGTDPSPYATAGLPADFASYCEFRSAD